MKKMSETVGIDWESECKRLTDENCTLKEEIRKLYEKCDCLGARYSCLNDENKAVKHDIELAQSTIENKNLDIMNLKNSIKKTELEISELKVYKRFYDDFHYAFMRPFDA